LKLTEVPILRKVREVWGTRHYNLRMNFTWPDPISLIADIVTFCCVPTLTIATIALWKQVKEAREIKIVSSKCVEFYDVDARIAVNLVPFENITTLPRVGDEVYLPGETYDNEHHVNGLYKVLKIMFIYDEAPKSDQPCAAVPAKICIDIQRPKPKVAE